jgi:ElaB/YqjD/DUF883 family membrane-anchored ribosome-binding protein
MANSRIENVTDKARETAANAGQTFQEAKGAAKDAAANIGQQAREYVSKAGEQAQDTLHSVGEGISSLAGTLREKAPHSGPLGAAAGTVAQQLDASGRYLREHDFGDIGKDLSDIVRRHPIPSVLCVFGIGFLLGGTMRR